MDCGPASLRCLLAGYGLQVSYGRLREACQTDVDGTSIDTMEEVAVQLGLRAEQTMVPPDHVLLPEAHALPAIVVVLLPNRVTHFVVAWSVTGGLVQVMDPSTGRRWTSARRFLDELYVHTMPVPAADWREWAAGDEFTLPLRRRLRRLGLPTRAGRALVGEALDDPGWQRVAALDAATRMVESLARARAVTRDGVAGRLVGTLVKEADTTGGEAAIPDAYWTVRPAPPGDEGQARVLLRGAVLVRTLGLRSPVTPAKAAEAPPEGTGPSPLSPELVAALEEAPEHPGRDLLRLLRAAGRGALTTAVVALLIAACGAVLEALLFRGLFDVGRDLRLVEQRIGALAALVAFSAGLVLLEVPLLSLVLRLGRQLEVRLRLAFLQKLPRLTDSYFHSRLTSDMAERSHNVHAVRTVAYLGENLLRAAFCLLVTAAGLIWLDPRGTPLVLLAVVIALGLPLAVQPILRERDLRVRNHSGALARFYLDALLGLVPIRAHGAERAVRREHESLLVEWTRASVGLLRVSVPLRAAIALAGLAAAALLVRGHLGRGTDGRDALLYIYWSLSLQLHGAAVALAAQQYPALRNLTVRLLEPLGAPERLMPAAVAAPPSTTEGGDGADGTEPGQAQRERGVALRLENVAVRVAGHLVLEGLHLDIAPGTHFAVVGHSGAGKSTLAGLFLGWHRPADGQVFVDGRALDEEWLQELRQQTAWVDPAVHLWNRTLLDNLCFGGPPRGALDLAPVMEAADLRTILESLPEGLQTPLGEGGALVSGGEGQRVRFGRGLRRRAARLVILDEPFRGLDREQRSILLDRSRKLWRAATFFCITHDVAQALAFDRVLVLDEGRIVEDGRPAVLAQDPSSRFRSLLDAEEEVQSGLWSSAQWRRLRLAAGSLGDGGRAEA